MNEFDVYILIDATGGYVVGTSEDACREKYEEDIGGLNECDGFRIVKVKLRCALPVVVEKALTVTGDEAAVTV